ncbi:hypothetical protein N183_15780 [Sinorhizobium sp. Sb3]|nr:hypothetical protein N183_15780 [Sinorhizobium sp. Sb3]
MTTCEWEKIAAFQMPPEFDRFERWMQIRWARGSPWRSR